MFITFPIPANKTGATLSDIHRFSSVKIGQDHLGVELWSESTQFGESVGPQMLPAL